VPHASLAARWSVDQPAFGGWVTTESEANISMFGRLGYDYVGIDTQHSAVSEAQAAVLVRRLVAAPFGVIVRVSKNDPALIGRLLDSGADGIIVPMVSTAEEAKAAVSACRYPPDGVRSFGPFRGDLGLDLRALQQRVSLFVMIETSQGLDNVRDICAVDGIEGVYIGPADLSIGARAGHGWPLAERSRCSAVGGPRQPARLTWRGLGDAGDDRRPGTRDRPAGRRWRRRVRYGEHALRVMVASVQVPVVHKEERLRCW
jgi:2-keto-3-deoxy-L-rhamnonate aldolase RhmA